MGRKKWLIKGVKAEAVLPRERWFWLLQITGVSDIDGAEARAETGPGCEWNCGICHVQSACGASFSPADTWAGVSGPETGEPPH